MSELIRIVPAEYRDKLTVKNSPLINSDFCDGTCYQYGDAYCRLVSCTKTDAVWIHGLISFFPGAGKQLLLELQQQIPHLRLNCLGLNLYEYYTSLGFVVTYSYQSIIDGLTYYELEWTRS